MSSSEYLLPTALLSCWGCWCRHLAHLLSGPHRFSSFFCRFCVELGDYLYFLPTGGVGAFMLEGFVCRLVQHPAMLQQFRQIVCRSMAIIHLLPETLLALSSTVTPLYIHCTSTPSLLNHWTYTGVTLDLHWSSTALTLTPLLSFDKWPCVTALQRYSGIPDP